MSFLATTKSYLSRVVRSDSTKHGVAAAGAGLILSMIVEAVWPSPRA